MKFLRFNSIGKDFLPVGKENTDLFLFHYYIERR